MTGGLSPYLLLLAIPILLLLFWPMARSSGRLKGDLIRGLADDLAQGRSRGYLIIAIVLAIVVIATVSSPQ